MSIKIDHAGMTRMVEFFQACNYRIQEVTQFLWNCYGKNAIIIDAVYDQQRRPGTSAKVTASAQMIIDKRTHEVFEISAADEVKNAAWKWYNPAYSLLHDLEHQRRVGRLEGALKYHVDQAWDVVNYKRTTDTAVLKRIRTLFSPQVNPRKPKKKASTARRKLVKASKRKKAVRSRR